jgi:putative transposase
MGYSIADNMTAEAMKAAYQMAISQRCYSHPLIHHSDRGLQYCSEEYVKLSTDAAITIR